MKGHIGAIICQISCLFLAFRKLNLIMIKTGLFLLFTCFLSSRLLAQEESKISGKLKVFIDCSNTWCDMTFIRSEINLVDYMLDRIAADVHLLITSQETGSGGEKYQLIFFGQNYFAGLKDTLHFSTDPNATDFEERDLLITYIKLGLTPFIAKTPAGKNIIINMKQPEDGKTEKRPLAQKDPWNYWVFKIGANGGLNADANYKNLRYSGNLSASRVTDDIKINFSAYANKNKSSFEFDDGSGNITKFTVNNHSINLSHSIVKSINGHWSWGYEANFFQSTFSNYKHQVFARTGIEYNIYPYKEVNNKLFTISYSVGAMNNGYYDTTIYDKLRETLFNHRAEANLTFNQKWGSASAGISYQNYLNNFKFFNLGINTFINVRITGGLSFNIGAFGGLTRDQVFLPKGSATEQEVLTRRRQLASGYNYYTSFGINYRFGSKLNNFVNPRFEGGGGSFYFF
jgi:hypothetical protein